MTVGYEYTLEQQENGWWLLSFPRIPEALSEGETEEEARTNAIDSLITALEGYMRAAGPSAPRHVQDQAVLPFLVVPRRSVPSAAARRARRSPAAIMSVGWSTAPKFSRRTISLPDTPAVLKRSTPLD
jgi:antitoxin HicB